MSSIFSPIDLSRLPAPDVIEALDYEQILAERKAYMVNLWPEEERAAIATRLALESDPLNKLAQESAYRELLLRQRINDACRAVMLAFATGRDLDHLGALLDVERQQLSSGDPRALPPVPPEWESDARFRQRIQLALEGFSTAGPKGAYSFHAFSASPQVKDVAISSPQPGVVRVTLLSTEGEGVPSATLLALVYNALNDEDVRPLCDTVEVAPAEVVEYQVSARLTAYGGPDYSVALAAAEAAVRAYTEEHHRLGHDITRSGLFAALHQPGVHNVALMSPAADLRIGSHQAASCTRIELEFGGFDV